MSTYVSTLNRAWAEHLAPRATDAPTVVSTFAGCGGSSLGYSMAGYRELAAIEWNKHAAGLLALNFPGLDVFCGDITNYDPARLGLDPGQLDVLDGSPPCQGFSTIGRRVLDDSRNQLFRQQLRLLEAWQPKVFVLENVTGLIKGKMRPVFAEIMRMLGDCGYRVSTRVIDASRLGVPQARQRVILVGVREDLGVEPVFPPCRASVVTVAQALADPLPPTASQELSAISQCKKLMLLLKPGQNGKTVLLAHGKKGDFYSLIRQHPHRPASTITSGADVLVHPRLHRFLNTAELARLQSFPDAYNWDLDHSTHALIRFRIGNSVPPLMMREIAGTVRREILDRAAAAAKEVA